MENATVNIKCKYCTKNIAEEDETFECPACREKFHRSCWDKEEFCATRYCEGHEGYETPDKNKNEKSDIEEAYAKAEVLEKMNPVSDLFKGRIYSPGRQFHKEDEIVKKFVGNYVAFGFYIVCFILLTLVPVADNSHANGMTIFRIMISGFPENMFDKICILFLLVSTIICIYNAFKGNKRIIIALWLANTLVLALLIIVNLAFTSYITISLLVINFACMLITKEDYNK